MTDNDLEKAIDVVGRDRVFMRAKAHGWGPGSEPPAYVWWGIVRELREGVPPPRNLTLGEVLGFGS